MSRFRRFVPVAPLVVPIVLMLIVAFVPHAPLTAASRPAEAVPIDNTTYTCPVLSNSTVIAGQVASGKSAQAIALPGAAEVTALADPTQWRRVQPPAGAQAVTLTQTGNESGAVGFTRGQGTSAQGQGLAMSTCPELVPSGWFLGLSSVPEHASYLIVTNEGSEAGSIDLQIYDQNGQIAGVQSRGIAVDAHSSRLVSLADYAAGATMLAVHIAATDGQISVTALDTASGTLTGTDFQQAQPAAKTQIIPAIAAGTGRKLIVTNTANEVTTLKVTALGTGAAHGVEGLTDLSVPAHAIATFDLPATIDFSTTALKVDSSNPVAAVVLAASSKDFAYAQPASQLYEPSTVPLGAEGVSSVMLSAPGKAAKVKVQAFSADAKSLGSKSYTIGAGGSVVIGAGDVAAGADHWVITVLGSSVVYGGAVVASGEQISSFPLRPAPTRSLAPAIAWG
jgi:hypothetical protein